MKVIQSGLNPLTIPRRHTCNSCLSKLEFTSADGHVRETFNGGRTLEVHCPVCSNRIEVVLTPGREEPKYTLADNGDKFETLRIQYGGWRDEDGVMRGGVSIPYLGRRIPRSEA